MREFFKTCLRCGGTAETEIHERENYDGFWYWYCRSCGLAWCADDATGQIAYRNDKINIGEWTEVPEGVLLVVGEA